MCIVAPPRYSLEQIALSHCSCHHISMPTFHNLSFFLQINFHITILLRIRNTNQQWTCLNFPVFPSEEQPHPLPIQFLSALRILLKCMLFNQKPNEPFSNLFEKYFDNTSRGYDGESQGKVDYCAWGRKTLLSISLSIGPVSFSVNAKLLLIEPTLFYEYQPSMACG